MTRASFVLLAPLLTSCSIDLLVTDEPASSSAVSVGQWGNAEAQDPWHPQWGLPLAVTEPYDNDNNTVSFNRLARTTGTIRLDADTEGLAVAISMAGANATAPNFGADGTLTAVVLRGAADALAIDAVFAGIDDSASTKPPPFLELTAVAVDRADTAVLGRFAGAPPIATPYEDAGFGTIPGPAGSRKIVMPGEQDGDGSVVLPTAVAHDEGRTWMAGAYYNGTLRLDLAPNAPETIFVDGQAMSASASVYFFDQGNGWRGNGMLLAVDDDDDEIFDALQLDSRQDAPEGAVPKRGYQELTSLAVRDDRALVGGRVAGYARIITDDDVQTPIAVHDLNEPVMLEHFGPMFFEVTRLAGESRSFGYLWHWNVSDESGPNVRGDVRAVGFDGDAALGCGTFRGDAALSEPRWMLVRRRDGAIARETIPGDPPGSCTAMAVAPAGIFLAGIVLEGDEPKARVILLDRDDLGLLASFDVPAPASHLQSIAVVGDEVYLAGAFRARLELDAPLTATGGDDDWDLFALRWLPEL